MRLALLIPLLATAVAASAAEPATKPAPKPVRAPAGPSEWDINVSAFIGGKALKRDDWDPIEGQAAFGVEFDIQHISWPVALTVNAIGSGASHKDDAANTTQSGSTGELQLGVRKIWNTPGMLRFTLAGGADLVSASTKFETPSTTTKESGSGIGLWASGGFYFVIARHFTVGPQVGISTAEVDLGNKTVQAGGIFLGVTVGGTF